MTVVEATVAIMASGVANEYYTLCYDDLDDTSSTSSNSSSTASNENVFDIDLYYQDYSSEPEALHKKINESTKSILQDMEEMHLKNLRQTFPNERFDDFSVPRSQNYSDYKPPSERYRSQPIFDSLEKRSNSFSTPTRTESEILKSNSYDYSMAGYLDYSEIFSPFMNGDNDSMEMIPGLYSATRERTYSEPVNKEAVYHSSGMSDEPDKMYSDVSSSSCESFEFPGMTIEIDPVTGSINVDTKTPSPPISEDMNSEPITVMCTPSDKGILGNENDDDLSSSGVSLNSFYQSDSSGSLSMEIERLRNIHSHSSDLDDDAPIKRAKSYDGNFLHSRSNALHSNRLSNSSTPTGRKSPLSDLFSRGKIHHSDNNVSKKKKLSKKKKTSGVSVRSSSPFMFRLKRSNSVSSKDKFKQRKVSKSLNDVKKDLLSGVQDDCNESTKLQQPSPFVRTIFQFVESSFDDDVFGVNSFNTQNTVTTPVFSCNGSKVFQESKTNSLSRKKKNKMFANSSVVRTVERGSHERKLSSTGRRISESSNLMISIIAYLDRIRKAKQKPPIASRRMARQKRNKSDPEASILKLITDIEVPSEDDGSSGEQPMRRVSSENMNTIKRTPYLPMTLNQRFTNSSEYVFTATTKQEKPNNAAVKKEPIIQPKSRTESPNNNDRTNSPSSFFRRTKSLRNIILPSKKKAQKKGASVTNRDSISTELRQLCNLDDEFTRNQANSNRNSGTDLLSFIRDSNEAVARKKNQKFPLSRTDCDAETDSLLSEGNNLSLNELTSLLANKFVNIDDQEQTDKQELVLYLLKQLEHAGSLSATQSLPNNVYNTREEANDQFAPDFNLSLQELDIAANSYENNLTPPRDDFKNMENKSLSLNVVKANMLNNRHSFEGDIKSPLKSNSTQIEGVHNGKNNKTSSKNLFRRSRKKYKRADSDDIEYWTGSFDTETVTASEKKMIEQSSSSSNSGSRRWSGSFKRKSKKDKVPKQNETSPKMDNVEEREESKKKGSILRTPSFRKKKSMQKEVEDQVTPEVVADPKNTKFSAIRSMFEPLKTQNDKKKLKVSSSKTKTPEKDISLTKFAKKVEPGTTGLSKTPSPNKGRRLYDANPKPKALTPPVKKSIVHFDLLCKNLAPLSADSSDKQEKDPTALKTETVKDDVCDESVAETLDSPLNSENIDGPSAAINDVSEDTAKHTAEQNVSVNDSVALSSGMLSADSDSISSSSEVSPAASVESIKSLEMKKLSPAVMKVIQIVGNAESEGESSVDEDEDFISLNEAHHGIGAIEGDGTNIVVDVPLYLLPLDLASKSPKSSPLSRRKGIAKKMTSPLSAKSSDSSKSNVKDKAEKINSTLLVEINNNIPEQNAHNKAEVDLSDDEENDDLDFTIDPEDNIDYSAIPAIPEPELLKDSTKEGTSYNQKLDHAQNIDLSPTKHYSSYSSMASSLFKDLYNDSNKVGTPKVGKDYERKPRILPPVKPKPKVTLKPKIPAQNVALVSPFNKNEVHETKDDSSVARRNDEAESMVMKRSKTVSEIGKNFEQRNSGSVKSTLSSWKDRVAISKTSQNDMSISNMTKSDPTKGSISDKIKGNTEENEGTHEKDIDQTVLNGDDSHKKTLPNSIETLHDDITSLTEEICEWSQNSTGNMTRTMDNFVDKNNGKSLFNSVLLPQTDIDQSNNLSSSEQNGHSNTKESKSNEKHSRRSLHCTEEADKNEITDVNNNCLQNDNCNESDDDDDVFLKKTFRKNTNQLNSPEPNTACTMSRRRSAPFIGVQESADRRSAPPTVGHRKRDSSQDYSKRRHHSTGHSPDITRLLQHLICDIEEEEMSEDEMKAKKEEKKLLDNFNSNLNSKTSYSDEYVNHSSNNPIRTYGRLRRTFSENDFGIKLLREQRQKRKLASGEKLTARRPSVIWARVKRMEVSLIVDRDLEAPEIIKIESFDVRRANTHKDIEELALDTFINHVQLLDKQVLDLEKDDVQYLKLADHKVPIGASFDLSFVKIQDGFLPCQLCIKGKEQWSLAAMAYDTLIPKFFLEKYISLILTNQNVIFYGPSGTGKSYLSRRLAMFISYRKNEGLIPPLIVNNITPDRWRLLLRDLETRKEKLPFVILLDGFSSSFLAEEINICDIIAACDQLNPKPYIICNITQTPITEIPAIWQLDFRWIWLPNHEEPIDNILQRFLRKKFIQYGNLHLQREAFRIADWLCSVWKHINSVIEKLNSTEATIGPTMFYTCPTDILNAEEWFVDLWNYSICPYFLLTVKQGLKVNGQRYDWEDPLEFILKTYPWVSEKAKRKMKLRRIRMEDVGYRERHTKPENGTDSPAEQQRLLEFLRQLEVLMSDGGIGELPNFLEKKDRRLESAI